MSAVAPALGQLTDAWGNRPVMILSQLVVATGPLCFLLATPAQWWDVLSFYEECGFDFGISVDHVILGYQPESGDPAKPTPPPKPDWVERQQLTLQYASEFLREHRLGRPSFTPLGVAQGWSPSSYAYAV